MKNEQLKIQYSIFEYGHYLKSVSCIFHFSFFIYFSECKVTTFSLRFTNVLQNFLFFLKSNRSHVPCVACVIKRFWMRKIPITIYKLKIYILLWVEKHLLLIRKPKWHIWHMTHMTHAGFKNGKTQRRTCAPLFGSIRSTFNNIQSSKVYVPLPFPNPLVDSLLLCHRGNHIRIFLICNYKFLGC